MKKAKLELPAISREVDFIARHWKEADAVWDGDIEIDSTLKNLTKIVYERAEADVGQLLGELQQAVQRALVGAVRLEWCRYKRWSWEVYGTISMPRGPKKRIGTIGLTVDCWNGHARVVGWIIPVRGGSDGRRELLRSCGDKLPKVHLVEDDRKRYPEWDDVLLWYEKDLSLDGGRQALGGDIGDKADQFLKIAKPVLKELAAR